MTTLFYERHLKKPVISHLFLEAIEELITRDPETNLRTALLHAIEAIGGGNEPSTEELSDYADALQEFHRSRAQLISAKPAQASPEEPLTPLTKKSSKKGRGSGFLRWIDSLKLEERLLLISDYDYDKAYHYYAKVPVEVVDRLWTLYVASRWNELDGMFEAVVYGMGGELKGGETKSEVHEKSKTAADEKERQATLKSIGF
jgi:hypothetical protein